MSNPISNVTKLKEEPALEVDEGLEAGGAPPELEIDPIEDAEGQPEAESDALGSSTDATFAETATEAEPQSVSKAAGSESRGRMGRVAFILAVLLILSFAYNLKQAGDSAALETRSQEMEAALTAAVDRIDVETGRANLAESKLSGIDTAVDSVNTQIESLNRALGELQAATAR